MPRLYKVSQKANEIEHTGTGCCLASKSNLMEQKEKIKKLIERNRVGMFVTQDKGK